MLPLAALTLWDRVLATFAAGLGTYLFVLLMIHGTRLLMKFLWRAIPDGRFKYALFKERGKADNSMINPNDPWVQAQWLKKPQHRTHHINAPAEFIPGERADAPKTGTQNQGPASRQ